MKYRLEANRTLTYDANRSEFTYDGLSRCVKIVEKTNGSVTSTRKFVWCGNEKCEFRDANDVVTLFAYPQGECVGTMKHFYFRDHLGSIREMMKANGTVVARYDYDPWGRSTTLVNTRLPDFNFTGLYRHSPSNLDIAVNRLYDPDLGRWLNRDPLNNAEVMQGPNLYAYVNNNPSARTDYLGLMEDFSQVPCNELKDKIQNMVDQAKDRYGKICRDKKDLYERRPTGKRSWEGHQQQYNENQDRLNAAINEYNDRCGGGLPAEAGQWATQPAPRRPSSVPDPGGNSATTQQQIQNSARDTAEYGTLAFLLRLLWLFANTPD